MEKKYKEGNAEDRCKPNFFVLWENSRDMLYNLQCGNNGLKDCDKKENNIFEI